MPENQGRLSPFSSSSGQHDEANDNHVEYYVRPSGGEDKMLDVNSSETVDRGYDHSSSTEPDPTGTIAMQKEATYTKPAELDGVGKYSTTANSTVDAPESGQTTEPSSVHKAACCDDCGAECGGDCCQKCSKMAKAAGCSCTCENCQKCAMMKAVGCNCCSDCDANCNGDCCDKCSMTSKAEEAEDLEKAAKPEDKEEEEEPADDVEELEKVAPVETKQSIWGNAFAPGIPTAAMRTVFRQE